MGARDRASSVTHNQEPKGDSEIVSKGPKGLSGFRKEISQIGPTLGHVSKKDSGINSCRQRDSTWFRGQFSGGVCRETHSGTVVGRLKPS